MLLAGVYLGNRATVATADPEGLCPPPCCTPNVKGFGYFPTRWREWPECPRPDKVMPQAIGAQVLPTPAPEPMVPPRSPAAEKKPASGASPEVIKRPETRPAPKGANAGQPGLDNIPFPLEPETSKNSAKPRSGPNNKAVPAPPPGIEPLPGLPPGPNTPFPLEPRAPSKSSSKGTGPKSLDGAQYRPATGPGRYPDTFVAQPWSDTRSAKDTVAQPEMHLTDGAASYASERNRRSAYPTSVPEPTRLQQGGSSQATRLPATQEGQASRESSGGRDMPIAPASRVSYQSSAPPFAEPAGRQALLARNAPIGAVADNRSSVAIEGYCPVELVQNESWVSGDARWAIVHAGRTYYLAGPIQRECFLANPERYMPAFSGADPVALTEENRAIAGRADYCVVYDGRLYMFSNANSLARFRQAPSRYALRGPVTR